MTGMGEAAERAATALLQAGGVAVRLRVPAPAAAGDDSEQLGLATPAFAEVALGRGAWRKAGSTRVLLVAGGAVAKACGDSGSAEAMFAGAAGVWVGETLYGLQIWEALRVDESVYGYSLTLTKAGQ